MKRANAQLSASGTTIFETMSGLARAHGATNLGQGFPDELGPRALRDAAAAYVVDGNNQYPPMMGLPSLRQAVAAHDKRFYGLDVDWQTEVLVTSGATEALLDCFLGLLESGDEVVILEPAYDTYAPALRRLGAVPRAVRLVPPAWSLPLEELAAAFSPKTKMLLLNSPLNPAGKVFTRTELAQLAALAIAHDVFVVCDEVYEHLVFGEARHVPMMTLPGMRERTARIGSAGKTFSITGWKVGPPARHVHDTAKSPTCRRDRARAGRRVLHEPRCEPRAQPRSPRRRSHRIGDPDPALRRHVLPRRGHVAMAPRRRR
jgi:N-succinyldiaminopimelate aminotransferase